MEFSLTILIGNDAIQDGYDLAVTLAKVADSLPTDELTDEVSGSIRDANGNTIGSYQVLES